MLHLSESLAKLNTKNNNIVLSYSLFSSGTGVSTFEKYGRNFIEWLSKKEEYRGYKIYINHASEPISSAGQQSHLNGYWRNYKYISNILKGWDITLITDSDGNLFRNWIKSELGWGVITHHWHLSQKCVWDRFYKGGVEWREDEYKKRFITINGNMVNEHKPMVMKMFTDLNLWDSSHWSFNQHTNFGMEIYRDKDDLFQIFGNLVPLFNESFLYIVTETVSQNFYDDSDVPMDFLSKMGRALWYPTPFVVVGNCGVLRRLKEMGFQTFDKWWDESYDDMEELNERMKSIYRLVEWISNLSQSEMLKIRNEMIPVFNHNRKILKELSDREDLEISKIFSNLGYEKFDYTTMIEYKLDKTSVYYYKELDGGGTTFGVNALRGEEVQRRIAKGKILEMCSGPGFMGAYLNENGFATHLYLSDINVENRECIETTIRSNGLTNVEFILSDGFDGIPKNLKFDTIVSNPPHFATNRPDGYRSKHEKLISLDADMRIHRALFKSADKFLNPNGKIVLVENATGISEKDIRTMVDGKWGVEYVEYSSYGWEGESTFYTIILYLL